MKLGKIDPKQLEVNKIELQLMKILLVCISRIEIDNSLEKELFDVYCTEMQYATDSLDKIHGEFERTVNVRLSIKNGEGMFSVIQKNVMILDLCKGGGS